MTQSTNHIHKLGLGLAAIGRPGYINLGHDSDLPNKTISGMQKQAHDLLDLAWKMGIRYYDMARSYGNSELFMASWLEKNPSIDLTIASKWGYVYTADWKIEAEKHEIKYHTLENYTKQLIESQGILGDHLNIYQIHSATIESGILDNKEVLQEMSKLKEDGIKVGLSLSGDNQSHILDKAQEVSIEGVQLFDVVQVTYNILEQSLTKSLAELGGKMKVVVKEAMSNGRLADYTHQYIDQGRAKQLSSMTKELSISPDQLALAFVMNQPFVDMVLSGASNLEHLKSNVKAASISIPSELMEILVSMPETAQDYWSNRSKLAWN